MLDSSHSQTWTDSGYRNDWRADASSENTTRRTTIDVEVKIGSSKIVVLGAPKEMKARIIAIAEQLHPLSKLGENWNSYRGHPIAVSALRTAFKIALDVLAKIDLDPRVSPLSSGGVGLDWRRDDKEVELEIRDQVSLLLSRKDAEREFEGISLVKAKSLLLNWLGPPSHGQG